MTLENCHRLTVAIALAGFSGGIKYQSKKLNTQQQIKPSSFSLEMTEFDKDFSWDRPSRISLSMFFESDGNGKCKCLFPGCAIKLSSSYSSNLFRHLKQRHPEAYEPKRRKPKLQFLDDSKCHQIQLPMTRETILRGCAELVTTNGQPFSLLQESGFRCILEPILNAFTDAGISIDISEEGIRKFIAQQTDGDLHIDTLANSQNRTEVLDVLDDSRSRDSENGFVGGSTGTDG